VRACVVAAIENVVRARRVERCRPPKPQLPPLDVSRITRFDETATPSATPSSTPPSSVPVSPRRRVSFHSSVELTVARKAVRSPPKSAVTNMPSCRALVAVILTSAAVLTLVIYTLLDTEGALAHTLMPTKACGTAFNDGAAHPEMVDALPNSS